MTTWKKYEVTNFKSEEPCVSIRRSGFAFNVSFMTSAKLAIGDFVEVFLSDDDMIGFKFFKDKQQGRLTITPDGGGKTRVANVMKANGFIACSHIKNDPVLSKLVSTKNSKIPVHFCDGLWVIRLVSQWKYNLADRKPTGDEIGVYRYLSDDEVVYIGRGCIQQRITSAERKYWQFDKIEYTLMSDEDSVRNEARLIREHRDLFGRIPFYNRNVPSIG